MDEMIAKIEELIDVMWRDKSAFEASELVKAIKFILSLLKDFKKEP